MYASPKPASALKALTEDPCAHIEAQEFEAMREEDATLAAYEERAEFLSPPAMERWEVERARMEQENHLFEQDGRTW